MLKYKNIYISNNDEKLLSKERMNSKLELRKKMINDSMMKKRLSTLSFNRVSPKYKIELDQLEVPASVCKFDFSGDYNSIAQALNQMLLSSDINIIKYGVLLCRKFVFITKPPIKEMLAHNIHVNLVNLMATHIEENDLLCECLRCLINFTYYECFHGLVEIIFISVNLFSSISLMKNDVINTNIIRLFTNIYLSDFADIDVGTVNECIVKFNDVMMDEILRKNLKLLGIDFLTALSLTKRVTPSQLKKIISFFATYQINENDSIDYNCGVIESLIFLCEYHEEMMDRFILNNIVDFIFKASKSKNMQIIGDNSKLISSIVSKDTLLEESCLGLILEIIFPFVYSNQITFNNTSIIVESLFSLSNIILRYHSYENVRNLLNGVYREANEKLYLAIDDKIRNGSDDIVVEALSVLKNILTVLEIPFLNNSNFPQLYLSLKQRYENTENKRIKELISSLLIS